MPLSFFISYAREDSLLVRELAEHLKARGASVRLDVEELRSGDDILSRLSAAVLEADFFVPIISDAWHKSNWCDHELGLAMAAQLRRDGQVRVLPWRLGDAEIPISMRGTHCPTIEPAELASVARAIVDDAVGHRGGGLDRPVTTAVARRFMEATLALDGPPPSPARVAAGSGNSPSQVEFMKARDAMRAAVEEDEGLTLRRLRHRVPGEYLLLKLGDQNRERLIRATDNGFPIEVLAVIARWWQLETYLRLLVYIQLRALLGPDWESPLQLAPAGSDEDASEMTYMASADDSYPLAHVDTARLIQLIDEYWEQCRHGIGLPRMV